MKLVKLNYQSYSQIPAFSPKNHGKKAHFEHQHLQWGGGLDGDRGVCVCVWGGGLPMWKFSSKNFMANNSPKMAKNEF